MKIKRNVAISDSGFIFNPATGDSYSVNPIGMEIVHMIQEGRDKEQIKLSVMNEYVCDESTFEKDFYDFTTMLRNHKLIDEDE